MSTGVTGSTLPKAERPELVNGALEFKPDKKLRYYVEDISPKVTPGVRKFLEEYAHIPPEQVNDHVHACRDKAWAITAYPCTGTGMFLEPSINRYPVYEEVLTRLKDKENPQTLLDIGTFIGQDLRHLFVSGVPSESLYATDFNAHWEVGYDLYNDRSKFHSKFIEASILSPNEELLTLTSKIDILYMNFVLHLWNHALQLQALKHVVGLSKGKGSIFIGGQIGCIKGGEYGVEKGKGVFLHDVETWGKLWEEVGRETGTKWDASECALKTWVEMGYEDEGMGFMGPHVRFLHFVVRRLE